MPTAGCSFVVLSEFHHRSMACMNETIQKLSLDSINVHFSNITISSQHESASSYVLPFDNGMPTVTPESKSFYDCLQSSLI